MWPLVDLALALGPRAAWLVPSLGALLGGLAVLTGLLVSSSKTGPVARSLRDVAEGRRVRLRGILARDPAQERLVLRTMDGVVTLAGELDLRGVTAPTSGGVDVIVEGFVGRVMRPALRESAGVLGLVDRQDGRFFEPIRLSRATRSRGRVVVLFAVGVASATIASLLGCVVASDRAEIGRRDDVMLAIALSGPTRSVVLRDIVWSLEAPLAWRERARRELSGEEAGPSHGIVDRPGPRPLRAAASGLEALKQALQAERVARIEARRLRDALRSQPHEEVVLPPPVPRARERGRRVCGTGLLYARQRALIASRVNRPSVSAP